MRSSTTVSKLALGLSWVAAAVIVLLPFHELLSVWAGSNFHHLDFIRIWKEIIVVAMLPAVGWLIWQTPAIRRWFLKSWLVRLFALYVLLHAVLGFWALSHHQVNASAYIYALIINLRFVGFFLVCLVLAAVCRFLPRNWPNIILWPALAAIIFGIMQIVVLPQDFLRHFGYRPDTIPAYQTVDSNIDYTRIQSTLRGANPLGAYLVLVIPLLTVIAGRNRWLKYGSLAGGLLVLYYTYSRSAWLGLILAILISLYLARNTRISRTWLVAGLAGLAVILIAGIVAVQSSQSLQDTLFHTSNSSKNTSSNSVRLTAIKQGVSDVYHQPLGRGPGTAGPASFRNSGHSARIAEDYFLQIGQEVGVLGVALLISIMAIVAYTLWQRRYDPLARILLASMIGLTFINLISHAWTDDTLAYVWWGLAGIVLSPAILTKSRTQTK